MANLTFAVRGNQLPARYSSGGANPGLYSASTKPSVVTATQTGLIGPAYIDMYKGSLDRRALIYPGQKNFGTNPAISILIRCAFNDVVSTQGVWQIGGPWAGGTSPSLMYMYFDGTYIRLSIYDETGAAARNPFTSPLVDYAIGNFTPLLDRYRDIVLTSNGVASSGGLNVYVDGNLIGQAGYQGSIQSPRDNMIMNNISIGTVFATAPNASIFVNEFVIWDGVIDPLNVPLTSGNGALNGQSRTAFVDAAAFDALSSIDPGTTNVQAGTNYTIYGVPLVGNQGATVDPGTFNVASGVNYEILGVPKVGTLNAVTNILSAGTLKGQSTTATLKGT